MRAVRVRARTKAYRGWQGGYLHARWCSRERCTLSKGVVRCPQHARAMVPPHHTASLDIHFSKYTAGGQRGETPLHTHPRLRHGLTLLGAATCSSVCSARIAGVPGERARTPCCERTAEPNAALPASHVDGAGPTPRARRPPNARRCKATMYHHIPPSDVHRQKRTADDTRHVPRRDSPASRRAKREQGAGEARR